MVATPNIPKPANVRYCVSLTTMRFPKCEKGTYQTHRGYKVGVLGQDQVFAAPGQAVLVPQCNYCSVAVQSSTTAVCLVMGVGVRVCGSSHRGGTLGESVGGRWEPSREEGTHMCTAPRSTYD